MKQLFPRRVEVSWFFRPKLEFYQHLNTIGLELESEFEDWQRGDRVLSLMDKSSHRALRMANGNVVYERHLGVFSNEEFEKAIEVHERLSRFRIAEYRRLQVLCRYAIDVDSGFKGIVKRLADRFFVSNESIDKIHQAPVTDVAYTVECQCPDQWKQTIHIGPMTRTEWFNRFKYDKFLFDNAASSPHSFSEFEATIPKDFVFLQVDLGCENVAVGDVTQKLKIAASRIQDSARNFVAYYKAGLRHG